MTTSCGWIPAMLAIAGRLPHERTGQRRVPRAVEPRLERLVALPTLAALLERATVDRGALAVGHNLNHVASAPGTGNAPIGVALGGSRLGHAHEERFGTDAPHAQMVGELCR